MLLVQCLLLALLAYLSCGLLVGVPFVFIGVGRVDHASRGTGIAFRLLILPGTVALWPLMAFEWLRATKGGQS